MGWSKDARVSQVRSLRDAAKSCGVPLGQLVHFRNLRRVCQEVVAKKGARARG